MDSKTYTIATLISRTPRVIEKVAYAQADKDRFEQEAAAWRLVRADKVGYFENDYLELFKTAGINRHDIHPITWENLLIEDGKAIGVRVTCGHYSIHDGMGGWGGRLANLFFSEYEEVVRKREEYQYYSCTRTENVNYYYFILPTSLIGSLPEFIMDGTTLAQYIGESRHVVIPEGVEKIGPYAFSGCSYIQEVTFPKSLKTIGKGAFWHTDLKEIVTTVEVETVEADAFGACKNLKRADFPSCTTIANTAFDLTPLQIRVIKTDDELMTAQEYYRDKN